MEIACRPGFISLSGDSKIECRSNGWRVYGFPEFAASPLVCCRQSSPFCPALVNGADICSPLTSADDLQCANVIKSTRHVGSTSIHSCAAGYRSQVSDTENTSSVCSYEGVTGVWKTNALQDLVCEKIENYCPLASAGALGVATVFSTEGRRLASLATLSCLEGYEFVSGDLLVTCGNRRLWLKRGTTQAAQSVNCRRISTYCPIVPGFQIMVSYSAERALESVASLHCAMGYEAVAGDTQMRCSLGGGSIGRWMRLSDSRVEAQALQCEKVIDWCPEPPIKRFAYVASTTAGRRMDSEMRVQCQEGFFDSSTSTTEQRVMCKADRKWYDAQTGREAVFFHCEYVPNYCDPLVISAGLIVNQLNRNYGTDSVLSCMAGYRDAYGRKSFRCGMGRSYRFLKDNSVVPQNHRLKCDTILNFCPVIEPINARVTGFSLFRTLGSEVFMACLPGHVKATGVERMKCQSDGTWDGKPLECVPVVNFCPVDISTSYVNAYAILEGVGLGDRARYTCNELEGEFVMGMGEIICSQNLETVGIWREASTGAPWSLPFVCAFRARQGVLVQNFDNIAFQGEPKESRVVPYFEYSNFESAVFHSYLFPDRQLNNCVFFINGTDGIGGYVNLGDQKALAPQSFDRNVFMEITAMMSYRPSAPTQTSFGNLLWKCSGDSEAYPVNSEYLIHSLIRIAHLDRTITL